MKRYWRVLEHGWNFLEGLHRDCKYLKEIATWLEPPGGGCRATVILSMGLQRHAKPSESIATRLQPCGEDSKPMKKMACLCHARKSCLQKSLQSHRECAYPFNDGKQMAKPWDTDELINGLINWLNSLINALID